MKEKAVRSVDDIVSQQTGRAGVKVLNDGQTYAGKVCAVYAITAPASFTGDVALSPLPANSDSTVNRSLETTADFYDRVPLENVECTGGSLELILF